MRPRPIPRKTPRLEAPLDHRPLASMRPRPIPRKTTRACVGVHPVYGCFNEAAADTAENGAPPVVVHRGPAASMRPRPIPRKTPRGP